MEFDLPQEFIIRRELLALQDFGKKLLELIPAGEVILAKHSYQWPRTIEVVWQERPYVIFEQDLTERAELLRKSAGR